MKQYTYSNWAIYHVVAMVVIFTVCLTLTNSQGLNSPLIEAHSNSRFKRSSAVSSGVDSQASRPLDAGSKIMETLQAESPDEFSVGSDGGSESQSAYYVNNRLLSQLENLGHGAFLPSETDPYGLYVMPSAAYDTAIKSTIIKREDPDSKGQFRLRFGRSGVRLRFGRSDPPTLRFG